MCARAHPSFDMTPTFQRKKKFKKKISKKKYLKSQCHTKRRMGTAMYADPSFGMTTTQGIRDLFVRRCPNNSQVALPFLKSLVQTTVAGGTVPYLFSTLFVHAIDVLQVCFTFLGN